jgi:hypothetical protein
LGVVVVVDEPLFVGYDDRLDRCFEAVLGVLGECLVCQPLCDRRVRSLLVVGECHPIARCDGGLVVARTFQQREVIGPNALDASLVVIGRLRWEDCKNSEVGVMIAGIHAWVVAGERSYTLSLGVAA